MTENEWLGYAKRNRIKLESLIRDWHPRMRRSTYSLRITAPNAEKRCEEVRQQIKSEEGRIPPTREFNDSLNEGNWHRVWIVLNETWFGVPESTECWRIFGFTEAVNLLEDPPEGEE